MGELAQLLLTAFPQLKMGKGSVYEVLERSKEVCVSGWLVGKMPLIEAEVRKLVQG